MEPMTRKCPHLGRYDVVFVTKPPSSDYNDLWPPRAENVAEVRAAAKVTTTQLPTRCLHTSVGGLSIGCTKPDIMEFATDCTDKAMFSKFTYYFCLKFFFFFYFG